MSDDLEYSKDANRRRQLLDRLDRMVSSGRLTDDEAGRLRAAEGPEEFDAAVRDVRVRHAGTAMDARIAEGAMSREEADALLERLRRGEHPSGIRADVAGRGRGGPAGA
jgi:hypothetical protein